ncbi:glycerophosphodiester phosphodiesterase [Natronohydrobacter thiooxidans]|uniref:glycerophosphodiester phosphodiesterase n=1 Tax=Natronohydrobacter thiooxidans TaxID=87172 RepID=UPI0008FF5523|nr:glycerophosphodiester phosphodiesterase [Natronohydrobacter thiooxidans]
MSRPALHPLLAHPGAIAIAHRGGGLEAEENTLPAFDHAVSLEFTHVELDVHATRDGVVVIHHDPELTRLCGDPRRIADLDWRDLQQVRTKGGAEIPRLKDLLETHPALRVTIEAKSDSVVDPLCDLIQRMGVLPRVSIGAFAPARTARARDRLGPGLLWSPAHGQVARLFARGWGLPLPLQDFRVVQIPTQWKGIQLVTARFLRAAHAAGVKVQVWTVNDEAEMHRLLDLGVDGLMTDRPALLRAVLEARGQWPSAAEHQHHDRGVEQK